MDDEGRTKSVTPITNGLEFWLDVIKANINTDTDIELFNKFKNSFKEVSKEEFYKAYYKYEP